MFFYKINYLKSKFTRNTQQLIILHNTMLHNKCLMQCEGCYNVFIIDNPIYTQIDTAAPENGLIQGGVERVA